MLNATRLGLQGEKMDCKGEVELVDAECYYTKEEEMELHPAGQVPGAHHPTAHAAQPRPHVHHSTRTARAVKSAQPKR